MVAPAVVPDVGLVVLTVSPTAVGEWLQPLLCCRSPLSDVKQHWHHVRADPAPQVSQRLNA